MFTYAAALSQAVPAAMFQVGRRHMRTRLKKPLSLRILAPSRNVFFNQTGMNFVTETSFCIRTPVVDDRRLAFRGCKSAREII